jgi:lysozyme family protein
MTFPVCLPIILASEGKTFVIDQGGPTELGVTMPALQAYLHRPVTQADIEDLINQPDVVAGLYEADYYNTAHCNELPNGLDLMVFDEAVNEGPGRGIRHLQESLGVTADGQFGPKTRAAVQACDVASTINAIHDTNAAYYASLDARFPEDERGWTARNDRTRDTALTMVGQ